MEGLNVSKRIGAVVIIVLALALGGAALALEVQAQPLVNLLLYESSIRDALSEISQQTGENIIPDSTVSGRVTVDLQDVQLAQALRIILIGGGYSFRQIDDFYFVGLPDPRSMSFREVDDREIVVLQHGTAGEIMSALPSFFASYVNGEREGSGQTITGPPW